ncbi:MAG: hypothetical protein WA130_06290 [Candidatus Methanoperedens sp.]
MEKLSYAKKSGGNLILNVTGILEEGKQYRIIKLKNKCSCRITKKRKNNPR